MNDTQAASGRSRRAQDQAPAWAQELSEKYRSGLAHAFVLHGNTEDYVGGMPGTTLMQYLVASFKGHDLIVSWDPANGFRLPQKAMRQRFAELAGLQTSGSGTSGRTGALVSGLSQMAAASSPSTDLLTTLARIQKPEEAFNLLQRVLNWRPPKKEGGKEPEPFRVAAIVDFGESIVPATESSSSEIDRRNLVILENWGRKTIFIFDEGREPILVLIVKDIHDLHERLLRNSSGWEQIALPFPGFAERVKFLERLLPDLPVSFDADITIEDVARLTTGLRYLDIEDMALRADFLQRPLSLALVKERKDQIMRSEFSDLLHIAEPEYGFEVLGGMQEVKQDLLATVVRPLRSGQKRLVPQGVLFMGPPGTGKTKLARALAKEAGVTFVELQLSKIFTKWLGSTERRLERALEAIKAWTPCIVFIDEIDQAVSRGESGESSGASNRVFKRLMEVMADGSLRGEVLWIAATNRADLLDTALLRPGRMDKKIPILAPTIEERTAILEVLVREAFLSQELPSQDQYLALVAPMENYTGAELEGIVGKALQIQTREDGLSVAQALQEAYERILPSTGNSELMTRLALLYCNDLDLVPLQFRDLAREVRRPRAQAELLDEQEEAFAPRRRVRKW